MLVVAAAAAVVTGMRESAPSAVAASELATPVWSVRRVPGLVVDPINRDREADTAAELQSRLAAEAARFGNACFEVRRGSAIIAAGSADAALIPASTQKLLVAAASLAVLGPDFRFAPLESLDFVSKNTDIKTYKYQSTNFSDPTLLYSSEITYNSNNLPIKIKKYKSNGVLFSEADFEYN